MTGPRTRRLIWVLFAAAVAVAIAAGAALLPTRKQTDPHAYPGSESLSLSEITSTYHLLLPACGIETIRYAKVARESADLVFMDFRGDEACVESFLLTNDLRLEEPRFREADPFRPSFGAEHGWPRPGAQTYAVTRGELTGNSSSLVDVTVAVDDTHNPQRLFLRAQIR